MSSKNSLVKVFAIFTVISIANLNVAGSAPTSPADKDRYSDIEGEYYLLVPRLRRDGSLVQLGNNDPPVTNSDPSTNTDGHVITPSNGPFFTSSNDENKRNYFKRDILRPVQLPREIYFR